MKSINNFSKQVLTNKELNLVCGGEGTPVDILNMLNSNFGINAMNVQVNQNTQSLQALASSSGNDVNFGSNNGIISHELNSTIQASQTPKN